MGGSLGEAVSVRSPSASSFISSRVVALTKQHVNHVLPLTPVEGISDLPSWVWDAVEEVVAETGAQIIERDSERLIVTAPYRIEAI